MNILLLGFSIEPVESSEILRNAEREMKKNAEKCNEMQINAEKYCIISIFFSSQYVGNYFFVVHTSANDFGPIIGLLRHSLSKGHNACQKWSEYCYCVQYRYLLTCH